LNELALSAIELFSGVGMLGEGVRAGLAHMGIGYRTCVHVEREAHAAAVLVSRMEEGSLDAAPIWSDVTTFDARAFRGKVDCVVAGFPCQDLSVAGRRAGLDGKRSGLFFEVTRIADDSGAWLIVLENVAGISSATATVMDEEEGELEERAAARVVGELADLGWNAEWINVSASDVGASHGRARWFCLAWRDVADAESRGRGQRFRDELSRRTEAEGASQQLGDSGLQHRDVQQRKVRPEHSTAIVNLDHADRDGAQRPRGAEFSADVGCEALGDTKSNGRREGRAELPRRSGRPDSGWAGMPVADTSSTGQQGNELGRACNGNRGGAGNTWVS
jgi:DNA (cytosine-5)-methyltransferase 1